jgi:isocitrate/isopropylmalate dehydrogenase
LADAAAIQIIINPKQFDVILTEIYLEIFYLMKRVITGAIVNTIGIIRQFIGTFEPIHGSFQKEKIEILPILLASILQLCFWSILDYMLNH